MALETELALARYAALAKEGRQSEIILPRGVHPHGKVNTIGSPYSIEINVPRFVELWQREFGLSGNAIERIEIHVIGEGRMEDYSKKERKELFPDGSPIKNYFQKNILRENDLWAMFNPIGDRLLLIIYGNLLWRIFNGDRKLLEDYIKRRRVNAEKALDPDNLNVLDHKTKEVLVSKKRIASMLRIPSRLDGLIMAIAQRELRDSLIHESDHIDEDVSGDKPNSLGNRLKTRILYIMEKFFPKAHEILEGRAEKKAEELRKKHEYFDLVKFRINSSQESESIVTSAPQAA